MTSPSRKKRQTTAPNSQARRTTNRPRSTTLSHAWLVQSIRESASIVGTIAIGLTFASDSLAQQPPAWSPQAFTAPQSTSTTSQAASPAPHNSLRAGGNTEKKEVARWRTPSSERSQSSEGKSYSQAINISVSSPPPAERKSQVDSKVKPASYSGESVDSIARSNPSTPASNGVWYDRSSETESSSNSLFIGPSTGSEAVSTRASARQRSTATDSVQAEPIRRVRYQAPQIDAPGIGNGQLSLPPAQSILPETTPSDFLKQNGQPSLERSSILEPPKMPEPSSRPGRSLLDPEPVVPNPFPSSKAPRIQAEISPSDDLEPPPMNPKKDLDRAPAPPKRIDRTTFDCDSIRNLAKDPDIRKIRIDSSPIFGEGIKDDRYKPTNTKEEFVANAPSRNWYNQDGAVVAEGKLVDIEYGMVIIERPDGSRTSFLMRKLSDYDQAYVSASWSVPMTCSIEDGSFPSRDFIESTMTWKASGACHKPLYFEDVQLERYGHEWGPFAQPAISTVRFFGDIAVLPYKMGIHPMNECQYSLGHYRPGSCAPWTVGPVPISLRGALMQAKVITGTALAMP